MVSLERIITIKDLRQQQICRPMAEQYLNSIGFTLKDLINGNITVQILLNTNDAMVEEFVRNLKDV